MYTAHTAGTSQKVADNLLSYLLIVNFFHVLFVQRIFERQGYYIFLNSGGLGTPEQSSGGGPAVAIRGFLNKSLPVQPQLLDFTAGF